MTNIKDKILDFYSDNEATYSLNEHLSKIIIWANSSNVPLYSNKKSNHSILENTIPLYININDQIYDENHLIKESKNFFILGTPGSGKSVLIKRIILKMLISEKREFGTPILIRAKELSDGSICNELKNIFNNPKLTFVEIIQIIDNNKFVIFLDGLDELSPIAYEVFPTEANFIYENLRNSKIISTSRIPFYFPNCTNCQIQPLTERQLTEFIQLNLPPEQSGKFILQLKDLNLNLNPLITSSLLSIYERYDKLPKNQISVYRRIINLFIEEWDSIRAIKRDHIGDFTPERKLYVLSFMAFDLINDLEKLTYLKEDLLKSLFKILPNINFKESEGEFILHELINYTGLITQIDFNLYQFSHKSLQEYFAADYLIKLPNIPFDIILEKMPTVLSFCVLLSSDSSYYLAVILDTIKATKETEYNLIVFLTNLFSIGEPNQFISFVEYAKDDNSISKNKGIVEDAIIKAYNNSLKK
jgi:predicted NACHT family NTPase